MTLDVDDALAGTAIEAARSSGVPGFALGLLSEDEAHLVAFGVTSVENPLPVTADTLFQIGSITKTFTGTLALLFVADGRLDLDAPVRRYLPDFRLADEEAAAGATMRHLLTHTGGWEGDYFDDPSRGSDALELMLGRIAELAQVTPLGRIFSYNNAGFSIAGRVLEVVGGAPFEQLVEERILRPLGLRRTLFFAEDVITERFAVGHHPGEDGAVVARPWQIPRASAPAGGLNATVGDLLQWARFHLGGEPSWLPAMREPQAEIRPREWIGLTWHLYESGGARLFGHDGGTNGQISRLLVAPAQNEAFAITTNSERGGEVTAAVTRAFLDRHGLQAPQPVAVDLPEDALEPYAGRYVSRLFEIEIARDRGRLLLSYISKGGFPLPDSPPLPVPPPLPVALAGEDQGWFVPEGPFRGERVEFLRDRGAIVWLRAGSRLYRREGP
jgi:CubicO group peptidase (beta-lactamase class C family)